MIYALSADGRRVQAVKGEQGFCPGCRQLLISKCGEIKVHHWAHKAGDCDPWYEPESLWHRRWKELVRPEAVEVVMGNHRADIVGNGGTVVELQASPILFAAARVRERFYERMIWLVDARSFAGNLDLRERDNYVSFRWKHPRQTWAYTKRPVFFDFGWPTLLHVKKVHPELPCGGWGVWISRAEFIRRYLSEVAWTGVARAACPPPWRQEAGPA